MPAECYSLTVTYSSQTQFAQNVFHYSLDDSGFSDRASAANALITAWILHAMPPLQACIPQSTGILSIKSRMVGGVGGFEAVQPAPAGTFGSRVGTVQVSGVCPVIIWLPSGNAKARGKTFLPGITDADCVDGRMQPTFRSTLSTQMTTFATSFVLVGGGAPTASLIVYQRKPTISLLPIQYVQVANILGTLRKRQRPV